MNSYKDTTFCASEVDDHSCGREFTEQDAIDAEKWWGGKDYPVAYSEFCEEADNTQPDHIVDTHEMVTDTNQASEDEMRENIDALLERWRNILTHKGDGNGDEYYQSDVVDDIQEIIRTEKLKLLEQVEAAIDDGKRSHSMAVIRAALTKLEAEL